MAQREAMRNKLHKRLQLSSSSSKRKSTEISVKHDSPAASPTLPSTQSIDHVAPDAPPSPQRQPPAATSVGAGTATSRSAPSAQDTSSKTPNGTLSVPRRVDSTIRRVPSYDKAEHTSEESSSEDSPSAATTQASRSAFSSSVNSYTSGMSVTSAGNEQQDGDKTPNVKSRTDQTTASLDTPTPTVAMPPQSRSPVSGKGFSRSTNQFERESSLGAAERPNGQTVDTPSPVARTQKLDSSALGGGLSQREETPSAMSASETQGSLQNGWDSTIGKAGLGKTGRVINRLVSDNDALKRDIQIERLRAEESKQAARLLEDKMERMMSEYESRLLEANVTKTLLARKERQVESLQATVDLERQRATAALERERTWREEMERTRNETKRSVEEATAHAALMEGRYNAISSHWRDQGDEVRRVMSRMGRDLATLNAERRSDDERIAVLRDLCDQQDGNIKDLLRQKEAIAAEFDAYRDEQEAALRNIKTSAAEREAAQQRMLDEAKEVLDKLRWALNVKQNIEWAQ